MFGFVKVAAAVPNVKVADCIYNKEQIINKIEEAALHLLKFTPVSKYLEELRERGTETNLT